MLRSSEFGSISQSFQIGHSTRDVVILGRSKERSDAAQTLGSMPRPLP